MRRALFEAYDSIDSGGRAIIIEGEAGIGKTRLAEELLAHARQRNAHIIAVSCYEGESHLAFGAIVAALRAATTQKPLLQRLESVPLSALSEVVRLLPELAAFHAGLQAPAPLDSPGAQSRFFEGIRHVLLALCEGEAPGILFFDDLHRADSASFELLSFLLRRLHEQPFCLLFTWRGRQPARGTPLHPLFLQAQRTGQAAILSLSRLDQSSVRELVQSTVAVHTNAHFADRL